MKKLLAFLLLSAALVSSPALACGNVETIEPINTHYKTMKLADGTTYEIISNDKVPYGYPFSEDEKQQFTKSVDNLEKLYQDTKNLDYLSDKGLVLMYLGRYKEAKDIFLQIEKIEPNRYSTASNLGTTYELLGDNKNALKWIKKAVAINPKSHDNSEWIHVNILQAKIKGEKFYSTEFILKTDFGNKTFPTSELSKRELKKLHEQLLYQLSERAHFIKPKNKIMAELIYALANTAFVLEEYSGATYNYRLAHDYGYDSKIFDKRLEQAGIKAEYQYARNKKMEEYAWIAFGVLILTIFVAIMVRLANKHLLKQKMENFTSIILTMIIVIAFLVFFF